MKRTLNVVLAVVLAVAMFASVAYVASPERTSEYQISLVSVKAVNVQDATQGVRSYAELVDTTRAYQVNDVIYLAITSEVKNLEKYPTLKSIANKDIEVVVGSPSIDLSYAKLGTPTLLANVWSGYNAVDVATVGWYAPAQVMLEYDKNANEVSWKFRGYTQYGMGASSAVASADYAKLQDSQLGNSYFAQNLVVFNPYFNTSTKKIEIPAIKLKKSESTWSLGDTTYKLDYEAPDAIGYTMVLTGVTKDNAGASKGTFYAKILISGAEKFEDYNSYWYGENGTAYTTEAAAKTGTGGVRWLNYVKVDIKKLEIAGSYNVYKYWIPSSALQIEVPAIYDGDKDDYNGADDDSAIDGEVLAWANPVKFDNATSKSNKLATTSIAGGIRTIKAYRNWTEANSASGKTYDYPATSVLFTNYKAVYAPGFYGGTWGDGDASTAGVVSSTKEVIGASTSGSVSPVSRLMVDQFELTLPTTVDFQWQAVNVYEYDNSLPAATATSPLIINTHYTVEYVQATRTVVVKPITNKVAHTYPLGDNTAPAKQQWIVTYDNTGYSTTSYTLPFWGLNQAATLSLLGYDGTSAILTAGTECAPVFSEVSSMRSVAQTGATLTFSNLVDQYGNYIDIQSMDSITNIDLTGYWSGTSAKFHDFRKGLPKDTTSGYETIVAGDTRIVGFTNATTGKDANGRQYVTISGLVVGNQALNTTWTAIDYVALMDKSGNSIVPALPLDFNQGVGAIFTFNTATTGTAGMYTDATTAAPTANWETGTNSIVVGHNGITLYTIASNSNDKPYVTMATETNYFVSADDGYGIAMFDNVNLSRIGARIYRSNDTNLAYSIGADHVNDGTTIISAMKYFGLDTSFGTTYKVVDATFESKGAAAVYSENVEGEFQYGTITIVPDPVEEPTEEEEVVDPDPTEEPEEVEPTEEPEIDEPEPTEEPVKVVKTGDASANVAIALAAAAIVAAAGLAFVMKKVR